MYTFLFALELKVGIETMVLDIHLDPEPLPAEKTQAYVVSPCTCPGFSGAELGGRVYSASFTCFALSSCDCTAATAT